jgi:hypothetical protein
MQLISSIISFLPINIFQMLLVHGCCPTNYHNSSRSYMYVDMHQPDIKPYLQFRSNQSDFIDLENFSAINTPSLMNGFALSLFYFYSLFIHIMAFANLFMKFRKCVILNGERSVSQNEVKKKLVRTLKQIILVVTEINSPHNCTFTWARTHFYAIGLQATSHELALRFLDLRHPGPAGEECWACQQFLHFVCVRFCSCWQCGELAGHFVK